MPEVAKSELQRHKNLLLGSMLQGIVHELNNFLCAALTNLQLAHEQLADDHENRELLEDSEKALQGCIEKIKEVTEMVKMTGGELPTELSLAETYQQSKRLMQYPIKHQRLTFDETIRDDTAKVRLPERVLRYLILQTCFEMFACVEDNSVIKVTIDGSSHPSICITADTNGHGSNEHETVMQLCSGLLEGFNGKFVREAIDAKHTTWRMMFGST